MTRTWRVIIAVLSVTLTPALLILGLVLIQKPYVLLGVSGKTTAVVRQPLFRPVFSDSSADIYAGDKKLFSLWEDAFDCPSFIYPFPDGKRFLCDYDYDVAMLDFVVDFRGPNTNDSHDPYDRLWGYANFDLARMATNVVFDTKGIVRLPEAAEIQEVRTYLTSTNPIPIRAAYLNLWSKEQLLLDLATNRTKAWPTK